MGYLSKKTPNVLSYRAECYVDNFSLLGYFTGIALTTKMIFYQETCKGRDRLVSNNPKSKKLTAATIPGELQSVASLSTTRQKYRSPKFWREYIKNLPKGAPPIVATAFVHVLSRQRIIDRGTTMLFCFIVGSTLFKLAIQESAKHYVLSKQVRSIRTMCVLVGVPTVLIDTQTRIILLGTNSTKTASIGALGMAFVEICLHVGKAVLVLWSIRRRKSRVQPQQLSPSHSEMADSSERRISTRRRSSLFLLSMLQLSTVETSQDFELWRRQVQAFHTADLNADMYAEYITIGCSASILFYYGDHPHYSLLRRTERT